MEPNRFYEEMATQSSGTGRDSAAGVTRGG